jgi:hypothetical protein
MFNDIARRSVTVATLSTLAAFCLIAQDVSAGESGPDFVYSTTPCRVLDTRVGSGVYAGKLLPNESLDFRTSNVAGTIIVQGGDSSGCLDIPSDATGLFLNIIAVEATGAANNDLGIKPWGSEKGGTALNYNPGVYAINNGLFVGTCWGQFLRGFPPNPSGCSLDLTISNGSGASANVVIDVTGFTRNY